MELDSYLEIFMTMYGWGFSRLLVSIMSDTGIIVFPFVVLLIQTYMEMHEVGESGVLALIRRLEVQVLTMFLVAFFCVMPSSFTSLSGINLTYTPPTTAVEPSPTTVTSADAGTTSGITGTHYDSTFSTAFTGTFVNTADPAAVPIWWYLSMGISSGISSAFRSGITNNMRDLRMLEELARMSTIEDPLLRTDVQRFYAECFVPARSMFQANNGSTSSFTANGRAILTNTRLNPPNVTRDTDWIGSHFYLVEPNYYDTMRSATVVHDVPIDYTRDTAICNPGGGTTGLPVVDCSGQIPMCDSKIPSNPPVACGRPTCKEWWLGTGLGMTSGGLRDNLVAHVSTWTKIKDKISNVWVASPTGYDAADITARLASQQANPRYVDPDAIVGANKNWFVEQGRWIADGASVGRGAALVAEGYIAGLSVVPVIMFLTMIQPLILMAIYMFLPTIVILGSFDLKLMVYGGLTIFTVKFWAVMWFVARWVDDHLIEAMKPGLDGNAVMEFLLSWQGNTNSRLVLNILLLTMYVMLPLVWTSLMAMIGVRIGTGIDQIMNRASQAGGAIGRAGGEMTGIAAAKIAGKAVAARFGGAK